MCQLDQTGNLFDILKYTFIHTQSYKWVLSLYFLFRMNTPTKLSEISFKKR